MSGPVGTSEAKNRSANEVERFFGVDRSKRGEKLDDLQVEILFLLH